MSYLSDRWFLGPGRYFWTSEVRLADLELGFCATQEELAQAIRNMVHAGREEMEMGGSAYRTHATVTSLKNKTLFPIQKAQRRLATWRSAIKLSA